MDKKYNMIKVIAGFICIVISSPWIIGIYYAPAKSYTFLPIWTLSCVLAAAPLYYQHKYAAPMTIDKNRLETLKSQPSKLKRHMAAERVTSYIAIVIFAIIIVTDFQRVT